MQEVVFDYGSHRPRFTSTDEIGLNSHDGRKYGTKRSSNHSSKTGSSYGEELISPTANSFYLVDDDCFPRKSEKVGQHQSWQFQTGDVRFESYDHQAIQTVRRDNKPYIRPAAQAPGTVHNNGANVANGKAKRKPPRMSNIVGRSGFDELDQKVRTVSDDVRDAVACYAHERRVVKSLPTLFEGSEVSPVGIQRSMRGETFPSSECSEIRDDFELVDVEAALVLHYLGRDEKMLQDVTGRQISDLTTGHNCGSGHSVDVANHAASGRSSNRLRRGAPIYSHRTSSKKLSKGVCRNCGVDEVSVLVGDVYEYHSR